MTKRTLFTLTVIGILTILGFVASAINGWHHVFDDAFITYRYAKNLALGHGITWNAGLAPTEGYTNFLLVVLLVPFIKLGLDPLVVTRVFSYISAFAMAVLLFAVAKSRYSCSTATASMIAGLILLAPQTQHLCLVGLETVIYALFLLMTFHFSAEFLVSGRLKTSILLSVLVISTMLLRPEAVFLYLIMCSFYCFTPRTRSLSGMRPLVIGIFLVLAIGLAYLSWKMIHFGHILPNPFYIKVAGSSLISRSGMHSVFSFFKTHSLLFASLCGSVLLAFRSDQQCRHHSKMSVVLGLGLILFYIVLFAHTDTLQDIHGRFMFPLLPILIYLSIPSLAVALTALENWAGGRAAFFPLIVIAFLLTFDSAGPLQAYRNTKDLLSRSKPEVGASIIQRELLVAQSLSRFSDIESIRIAFGDSGVIPYYTGSVWLDVVGLNDGLIARTRDKEKLVDYFFSFQPDLVIHPGQKDFSWITYGHGTLGDYVSWADDPRWDEYVYVGTCITVGSYDLQFLVRRSSRFQEALTVFLHDKVIDGQYAPFPYAIGTYTPNKNIQPTWVCVRTHSTDL